MWHFFIALYLTLVADAPLWTTVVTKEFELYNNKHVVSNNVFIPSWILKLKANVSEKQEIIVEMQKRWWLNVRLAWTIHPTKNLFSSSHKIKTAQQCFARFVLLIARYGYLNRAYSERARVCINKYGYCCNSQIQFMVILIKR